jgi:starvation-inducible DNA-binding protein
MSYMGISGKDLSPVVETLNQLLCDYHLYYQNLRNFHWNIRGSNFFELHTKFEQLYDEARLNIDAIAERILTLRGQPISTLTEYLQLSQIGEATLGLEDRSMVETVIDNQTQLIQSMRLALDAAAKAEDEGTTDLLGGFLSALEKNSWMLAAWIGK